MKQIFTKSLAVIFAVAALSLSCNRTQTPSEQTGKIDIVAQIESTAAKQQSAPSRAGAVISKAQFVAGDQIGLWVVPYALTDNSDATKDVPTQMRGVGNYLDNVLHSFAGGKFVPTTPIFYPNATAKVDLYSVYPYNALMSDRTSNSMPKPEAFAFAVAQDQNVADGTAIIASDIMTAVYKKAKDGANGTLVFNHRMSRVLVGFTLSKTYKGANITAVKSLKLCGVKLKSLINITDTAAVPDITTPQSNEKVEITAYQAIKPDAGAIVGTYQYEAIVAPGVTFAKGDLIVKLTLEVVGLGDVEFLCEAPQTMSYATKKQTHITLDIMDKSPIAYGSVSIQGWGDPIEIVVGSAKPSLMNFKVTSDNSSRAANVMYAKLGIDDTTYVANVVLDADVLKCTYLQPDDRFGEKLKKVELFGADKVTPIGFASATPAISDLYIPGDPTLQDYAVIISTLKFD